MFDQNGKRLAIWDTTHDLLTTTLYWGALPLTYTSAGTYYSHQDLLGTKRLTTTSSRAVAGSYQSLAFGDQFTTTGTDPDPAHFADLDHDTESGTEHAQLRQYASTSATWMSPDPYDGSYNTGNPQSLNRYVYVLNNPLASVDPSGQVGSCGDDMEAWDFWYCVQSFNAAPPPTPTQQDLDAIGNYEAYSTQEYARDVATYENWMISNALGNSAPSDPCSSALAAANRSPAGVTRADGAWSILQSAADANGIPTSLVAAIGVRESNFMNVQETLQGGGAGPGMGVFQLTNQPGVSPAQAFDLSFSANFAAGMLAANMNYLSSTFSFTPTQLLQATAASYNFGTGNISGNPNTIDVGTTGGNYGSTVVGMMACFANN